jgi:hypothetical protein
VMVVTRGSVSSALRVLAGRSRILHARPSPWSDALLIEQVWPVQILDHQPNRFSCVPGQLIALGCGPAAIGSELPGKRHDLGREPTELRAIRWVNRPRLRSAPRAKLSELVSEPAPRISCQLRIPYPRAGLRTKELRMIVGDPERPRRVGKTIKQVGAPQRPVHGHELRGRLATSARMRRQLPQLDPDAVLHGGISQVNLEPVPDDDRSARQGENVLHGRLQQGSALPSWPALTSRAGADPALATAIVAHPPAVMPTDPDLTSLLSGPRPGPRAGRCRSRRLGSRPGPGRAARAWRAGSRRAISPWLR